jgi:ferredoxin
VSEIISRDGLAQLVDEWIGQGRTAIGPVGEPGGHVCFTPLTKSGELCWDGFVHPENTAKEFVFPKHEKLYSYRYRGNDVELVDQPLADQPVLLIGSRPCDAAAFPIIDRVMNWDYRDSQYNARRAAMTVVTLACKQWDEQCFCTSVHLGPAADRGSDVLLFDLGDRSYEARALSDKGRDLLAGKTRQDPRSAVPPAGPQRRFDVERVQAVLKDSFASKIWQLEGLRCLGCGSCSYTCPTCHCFDIVDEAHAQGGCRVRNWDSCQFRMFSLHASGHNPRPGQPARQRQRNMHKFVIYPEKFGDVLCTGCGNCFRNCPVSLGVLNIIRAALEQRAAVDVRP